MGLREAKRMLQWKVVMEALADAGVDAETLALVESARFVNETVHMMASALLGGADTKQAKNYIKVDMIGMIPPFERAYIELIRPAGKTSHELRELLRDRLTNVRRQLSAGTLPDWLREGLIQGIDEDLSAEAP